MAVVELTEAVNEAVEQTPASEEGHGIVTVLVVVEVLVMVVVVVGCMLVVQSGSVAAA